MHESYLRYRNARWLKGAIGLLLATVVAYLATGSPRDRGGGTPAGYALGVLATLLMLWLTWFGVRKRRYHPGGAPLRGWLSAHVYLGSTLLFIVPLHCAFQFGWNVHTLAYGLLVVVIVSGLVGVGIYTIVPARMTQNRPGERLGALFEQVGALDAECTTLAAALPTIVATAVATAIETTAVGGGLWRQLVGSHALGPTNRALAVVQSSVTRNAHPADLDAHHRLLEALATKRTVIARLSRDVRLKALLDAWLLVHVPLAVASLATVAVHVFVVLAYR